MLVVSDTTPINYLILIGAIDVLPYRYTTVVLPTQVVAELRHAKAPDPVRRWMAEIPDWIDVRTADETRYPSLDAGEAAALALALDLDSPLLADEAQARSLAHEAGVRTIGTVGILAEAHTDGLLDFEAAVAKLRTTNFRVHESLVQILRRRIEEAQNR